MALGDVYRVDFEMTNDDKSVMSSIHYEEVSPTAGTALEVATAVAQLSEVKFWTDFWRAFVSIQVTYLQTKCQQIYPIRNVPFFSTTLNGDGGVDVGAPMNGTTAMVVALYGQTWSPHFRGRAYLPGLPEASVSKGRLLQAKLDLIQPAATTFYEAAIIPTAPASGSFLPVVFSPSLAKPPPAAEVTSFLDTIVVRPRIGTQRSRRTQIAAAS